jgi:hypothetical protein
MPPIPRMEKFRNDNLNVMFSSDKVVFMGFVFRHLSPVFLGRYSALSVRANGDFSGFSFIDLSAIQL